MELQTYNVTNLLTSNFVYLANLSAVIPG